MTYEDFCTAEDVAAYKRVKRIAMRIADVARGEAAAMVGGRVESEHKQFVVTRRGVYRLAMAHNSDNSTERGAHDLAGAETVVMGDEDEMTAFFRRHGVDPDGAYDRFQERVRAAL